MSILAGQTSDEERLWPPHVDLTSVGLGTLAALVAGFIGGLFAFVGSYIFVGATGAAGSGVYPYILSLIAFFSITIALSVYLVMQRLLFPDKYRGAGLGFGQMLLFSIFSYALATPLYIYIGTVLPQHILIVFSIHVLVNLFGGMLLLEIIANYRYVLLGVYGKFLWFFASIMVSVVYFASAQTSSTALYALLGILTVSTTVLTFVRLVFEYAYSLLYRSTGIDPLWDVFAQIEAEELRETREAERRLSRFDASDPDL